MCGTMPGSSELQNGMNISGGFTIVECHACGHLYTYFNEEVSEEDMYQDGRYKIVDNRNSIFDKLLSFEYKRVIRKVRQPQIPQQSVLDFGSGKGKFLALCKEAGFRAKGVETSVPRAEFARKHYQLDIDSGYYSEGKLEGAPFNLITSFHVLEHLTSPKKLLLNLVSANLAPGGRVVIEVPNINSWQAKLAGKDWLQLDVPRHISHFNSQSINSLISSAGLGVVKTSYFSFHVGLLGMLRTCLGLVGYKGDIIYSLKNKKSISLYLLIALLLPIAIFLEMTASVFSKGGIVRVYAVASPARR